MRINLRFCVGLGGDRFSPAPRHVHGDDQTEQQPYARQNPRRQVKPFRRRRRQNLHAVFLDEILQDFVQKYGVKVLAAPPPKGFNLTAWILPGVGLLFGLIIAVDVTRRWRKPVAAEADAKAQIDPHLLAAVEDEMKKTAG